MSFVENDELVERVLDALRITVLRVGKKLEERHEQAERFVLLDELIAKVNDDDSAAPLQ